MSVRWLGHATVLINQADTWILTDPVLRGRVAHLRRRVPVLAEDWPAKVDAVLISHMHWDHLDLPTLRTLGNNKLLMVPQGAGHWLERRGFRNVVELPVGDRYKVEGLWITAVPALHSGRRPPFGPTASAVGYIITGEQTVYFPGDTDLFPEMASLTDELDLALMPIWGWGPTLGTGHLDPTRAAEATRLLSPRLVIPIHWGTFHPIGTAVYRTEFLSEPPLIFEHSIREMSPDTEVRILEPGERLIIDR